MKRNLLLVLMFVVLHSPSLAAPIYNPVTGNYYDIVTKPIEWEPAKMEAESIIFMGLKGYLATITSAQENWWIVDNLGGASTLDHWLGGYYGGGWQWITGESWEYTNWGWTEPTGDGDALEFDDYETTPPVPGYWNDIGRWTEEEGYIVEWETRIPAPVPIPGSIWLLGSGLAGLIGFTRLKRNKGV